MTLDPIQIRVLGALIEKEIATPENYPLSLNSLVNACNQRSSRDPVLNLSEEEVRQALHALDDMGLTAVERSSRVDKYEHRIRTVLNLRRDETALLCLLFLRGPQTPGELRSRADRLYSFDGLDAVESTLARMTALPETTANNDLSASDEVDGSLATRPLAVMLPRQPGSRESRYAHLLGGPIDLAARDTSTERLYTRNPSAAEQPQTGGCAETSARLDALETEVSALRSALTQLQSKLNADS
ncbi:MAG: DUF480 domain-containing protein [Acidobacteriaceae bacterium]|nr:DUF480 domain-containing protein [Acidobacteriaceae bacterium]